jgi:alpha-glucosidase (family GH31 glycosyl hydrolase)
VPAASAADAVVDAGALRARVQARPFALALEDARGRTMLGTGRLAVRSAAGTPSRRQAARSLRVTALRRRGGSSVVATVATAGGGTLRVRVGRAGEGIVRVAVAADAGATEAVGASFAARRGELFTGFGQRSDRVDRRGGEVLDYVSDGPYRAADRALAGAVVPPWGRRDRDDDSTYPVPWLLSSAGYGVLVDDDATSRYDLGRTRRGRWAVTAEGRSLALRIFAGPRPADALRRFTRATGRQPAPPAPWAYGPWVQTGQPNVVPLDEEARIVRALRDADAPVSAAETQMHFLPCGAHRGREAYELARTAQFHAAGLAHLSYVNPHLCASYRPVFDQAAAAGLLQRGADGRPLTFGLFVGGEGSAGFTVEPLAQFDFTAPGTEAFYERLVRELVDQGKDGWMEDFGELTSLDVRSADGTPGPEIHNRYPRDYHCALQRIARRLPRPVVRFQRSGWTGAARCSVNVWGGDPTTVWDFDGLRSAVTQALTIGMSGVARWGSDIGGYTSFGTRGRLDRELLHRWIQLGAVSAVMRTKRSGIALPAYERPQVFDPASLPVWRRWAKLHTRLLPYLQAADAAHRATGLPIMRHGLLTHPGDRRARRAHDQYLFGPDLLAAPVLEPGAVRRRLYLPRGRWVDLWRSARYVGRTGGLELGRARMLRGRRAATLPAPADELPLLARAGAVIPLLSPDVDTLAPYRGAGVVRLADRLDRLHLLAFPRGRSGARMGAGRERLRSVEGRRAWTLAIRGTRARRYLVQASLRTLRRPFAPRVVLLGRRPLSRGAWSYDRATGVLRVAVRGRRLSVTARG